jgi:prepilin-type processing-associated H-X9-DG protein
MEEKAPKGDATAKPLKPGRVATFVFALDERPPLRPDPDEVGPLTSYVANTGFSPRPSDPSPFSSFEEGFWASQSAANGVFFDHINADQIRSAGGNSRVRMTDLRDGTSNTLLFSENLQARQWFNAHGGPDPENSLVARVATGFNWLYFRDMPGPPPAEHMRINGGNLRSDPTALAERIEWARPSSYHANVVNVAFADGRVIALREDIQYDVYQQLMTGNGSRSVMPNQNYILRDEDYQ